jgi:hypothetical protein
MLMWWYIYTGNAELLEAAGTRDEVFQAGGRPKGAFAQELHIWLLRGRLIIYTG